VNTQSRWYPIAHRWANRVRVLLRKPAKPKRCCLDLNKRQHVHTQETTFGRITVMQCDTCRCRHHEMEAHPGVLGVTGS